MAEPCEPIRSQVRGQEALVVSLQDELHHASPQEKPFIISQIRDANQELVHLKAQLTACDQAHPKPDAVVLTTATCPICTDEQISTWRHVVLEQLGVDGIDVDGHWIGAFPNDSKQFFPNINNWIPLASEKRVLCGKLHHFDFYDPFTSGDEADWNNFIIPSPAFANLIEDAKVVKEPNDDWHSCEGKFDCMEAEITPDETYFENLLNSKELDRSALEGETICTYGPWVHEHVHSDRPEIHPSELYWWRSRLSNGKFAYNLMQLQEDSNRFDREENYDFGFPWDDPPPGWRAWSAVPRTNRFRIAFELDPSATTLTFRINQIDARFVQERWNDQTPGSTHDLQYNGKVVLRVEELLPNEGELGVAFGSVCRNAENTRLQGYIALIESVGEDDRGKEGYQTLQVQVDNPPFFHDELVGDWPEIAPLELRTSGPIVRFEAKPNSLRRVASEGVPSLAGDVEVQLTARPGAAQTIDLSNVNVVLVTASGRRKLQFQPTVAALSGKESSGVIAELPLTAEATLEITADGEAVSVPVPTLSLAPRVVAVSPQQLTKADGAWKSLAKVAAGRDVELPVPGSVQRSRQWRIEAAPSYAPVRAGKASPEDESPFAEALNDVVRTGNKQRLSELFGTAAPFRVNWSFRATNLTTGKPVPVRRGANATPTDVRVDSNQGGSLQSTLDVTFPQQPANAVFELIATAKMRDPFGVGGTVQQRISSHVITQADARELARTMVQTAATLAGASPDDLDSASDLGAPVIDHEDDNPRVVDLQTSRAQMVRLLALDASQDQRITVDELRRLVQGAKQFAEAT